MRRQQNGRAKDDLDPDYERKFIICQPAVLRRRRWIGRDEDAIARWRDRNVFSIPACQSCPVASVCGGGCGAVAVNRTGTLAAPDCRPVRELLGLGARFYRLGDD